MTSEALRKILVSSAALALLAFVGAPASAQPVSTPLVSSISPADTIQVNPNGYATAVDIFAQAKQLRSWVFLKNSQHLTSPVPTVTTSVCGGSAAVLTGGDDSGQVAEGSSASTSCVITFAVPFVTAPECFVSLNNVADTALKCSTSTTALTVTQTSASSNVLNYLVVGLPGG